VSNKPKGKGPQQPDRGGGGSHARKGDRHVDARSRGDGAGRRDANAPRTDRREGGRAPHPSISSGAFGTASPLSDAELSLVRLAIAEDLPRGDITSRALFAPGLRARARVVARENAVVAGLAAADAVFREIEPNIELRAEKADGSRVRDGDVVSAGDTVLRVEGHALAILAGERTALNFLARLSGVATATRAFVDAVAGTGVQVLDTRKTTPGWRTLEKAAVRSGGGTNHRPDASSMILVKDNHRVLAGSVKACLAGISEFEAQRAGAQPARAGSAAAKRLPVEIEAESLEDVRALVAAGVERILLDNMAVAMLREAVAIARASGRTIALEASGGVRLENARAIAETGVDAISVGALTHSARAIDFSLEIER
jgi:nicotinate-nucleotide pyrophosphorylase (carboxylating)